MVGTIGMKGITNAEIREKFELIESELQHIKRKKQVADSFAYFFILSAVTALIATIMMIIEPHPIIMFFSFLGISQMIVLLIYKLLVSKE